LVKLSVSLSVTEAETVTLLVVGFAPPIVNAALPLVTSKSNEPPPLAMVRTCVVPLLLTSIEPTVMAWVRFTAKLPVRLLGKMAAASTPLGNVAGDVQFALVFQAPLPVDGPFHVAASAVVKSRPRIVMFRQE